MNIYFDMDGTIADLYGVENWLDDLNNKRERPYKEAAPIWEGLDDLLHTVRAAGHKIGIVSWMARNSTKEYDKKVREAKKTWLKENFTADFSEIHIIKYGTPKSYVVKDKNGILFDDEEKNRKQWKGQSYKPEQIFEVLRGLT